MNKRHWVSVNIATINPDILFELLEDAHHLVAISLPRVERIRLLGD